MILPSCGGEFGVFYGVCLSPGGMGGGGGVLNVLSSYVVFFSCGCHRLIDVVFQTWEVDIG